MWMGIDNGIVAWVSDSKVLTFEGQVLEAPVGAEAGMGWDGKVLTPSPNKEQSWVISEMSVADIEINKHDDGDARAIATEAAWRAYRCQLRDYVKGGQIVGERPVRPI